eukprot:CAMPEP_0170463468 /NCGR_PEP_ID=MMETSP0123-20130129/8567_1 /TAXON_ID=182087 /ORGANISM="Favella ehrenbergii, Strain Fehren 1" /LENGTH=347 /DNA_ID=CAMNT_0010728905 /DNA_START=11 /DNA_END=1054 /DNA_ORIENTATION=+
MAVKTAAINVGPGQYDIDSLQHKQLMAAIYPKKSAPFNSSDKRSKEILQKSISPGPGQYEVINSPSMVGLAVADSYIVNDNGHMTQRTQPYAMSKKVLSTAMLKEPVLESPGPGQYESFQSDFISPARKASPRGRQGVINPITVLSPVSPGRAAAAVNNPSLQKMSVPSIPSRFLTPIIDAAHVDTDSGDICKMSRLVDDPSKVGPGTYEVIPEVTQKSPRGTINWQYSMSQRGGIKPSLSTSATVGPGSYNGESRFYKPSQPFFSRHGALKARSKTNRQGDASIRGDFEIDGDSDNEDGKKASPGPGAYLTSDSSFKKIRPNSLQLFGSNVKRFVDTQIDSGLGPG